MVLAGEKLKESKKKAKMASATSSSQRDWGKVRWPRPACPQQPCCPPTLTHSARSSLFLECTGHGVRGAHQGVHHCSIQPLWTHPRDPRGHHVEIQSPGTPKQLELGQHALAFQKSHCLEGAVPRTGGTAGIQASSSCAVARIQGRGSCNRCDAFGGKVRPLALKAAEGGEG